MSLIWHNFILFIQLFKRLLNLKVDMRYTYSIILDNNKFILIKAVTGLHRLGDCDKCIFDGDCYYRKGIWLCNDLDSRVRYICDFKKVNNVINYKFLC